MLSLDVNRPLVAPRAAATVLALREPPGDARPIEVFCVERSPKSGFLAGAVVFPGGKVDAGDRDPAWAALTTLLQPRALHLAPGDPDAARALAVAACRELFEEAGLLPLVGDARPLDAPRAELASGAELLAVARAHGLQLDLAALTPFARWVTPTAESRRFDTAFYLLRAPTWQAASHDAHETTGGFWATPREVLARWHRGEIQLIAPTIRCLELLRDAQAIEDALAIAAEQSLAPILPELLLDGDAAILVLPGDPRHSSRTRIVAGATQFAIEDGRFAPPRAEIAGSTNLPDSTKP